MKPVVMVAIIVVVVAAFGVSAGTYYFFNPPASHLPIEEQPGEPLVVDVSGREWHGSWQSNGIWNMDSMVMVRISSGSASEAERIAVPEAQLASALGVESLYCSNGTAHVYKGSSVYDLNTKAYTGTGFIFKHASGKWYIRQISIESVGGTWEWAIIGINQLRAK